MRFHADPTLPVRVQMLECGPKLVADPEHLALLQQGVDVWNAWRQKEPSVVPDLRGADLSGEWLGEANLSEADLSGANLSGANLTRQIYASPTSARQTLPGGRTCPALGSIGLSLVGPISAWRISPERNSGSAKLDWSEPQRRDVQRRCNPQPS